MPLKNAWEAEINLGELNMANWKDLEILMPWGQMNQEPVLMLRQTSKARLLEQVSLDSSGLELPSQGAMDIVITWKAPNLAKVLSYSQA